MRLSDSQLEQFHRDGYVMIPGLFTPREMDLLLKIGKGDRELAKAGIMPDAQGGQSKIWITGQLRDDNIYGAFVRSPRILEPMTQVLGGDVYHWHHKMMIKEPFVGGAWEWHQDYGYWYNDACLYPLMASCMIAVDRSSKENGCLQVIQGSHHLGRINHGTAGGQAGADMERVNEVLKKLPLVYCEMEPGTALFFHSNVLHRSDQNKSPNPRWSLICCYNAVRNAPYREGFHGTGKKLDVWPDTKIVELGEQQWAGIQSAAATAGV